MIKLVLFSLNNLLNLRHRFKKIIKIDICYGFSINIFLILVDKLFIHVKSTKLCFFIFYCILHIFYNFEILEFLNFLFESIQIC